ncbi:MAG: pilus assembly protein PilM, partial [Planctomycetales bacterium]|nr:pilus assembly protein PilM [Planctomycetales bacterium]
QERIGQQKQRPLEVVPWARAPQETAVGAPVLRFSSFGAIDVKAVEDQPLFAANAPRLYAAVGAALQGLGKAAINTNLLPRAKGSVLGQLGRWTKRSRGGDAAWGFELTASGLKAVKLTLDAKTDAVSIAAFDVVEHASPLGAVASDTQRRDLMDETVKKFLERNPLSGEPIVLVFPGAQVLGRFFEMPPVEVKRIDDLMLFEAKQQVPFPLEQLNWDYHVWFDEQEGERSPRRAMLVAARHLHVTQRVGVWEDAGVKPQALQCDAAALYNFYDFAVARAAQSGGSRSDVERMPVALLDVGADGTNLVVAGDNLMWFRSIPRGSDDLNRALMRRFEVSFTTAEQLKRHPTKSKQVHRADDVWQPVFGQFVKDVQDSLAAYNAAHPGKPVAAVEALGGGFAVHGLHRRFLEA